jgi:hypothetical protein
VNAKQIKPYAFWIVSGVIILVELGLIAFYPLTDADGKTPEEVKAALDNDFKKLQDLYDRAGREPKGVYDAENPTDIANLTTQYLLTPRWKNVLQPLVDKYTVQLADIRKDLAERSVVLHQPIAESGDLFAWYNAYTGKTKEVLLKLRDAKALAKLPDEKPEDLDLENSHRARKRAGFFTKDTKTPEAGEHPLLTTRFRIMERLSEAVIGAKAKAVANPVVKTQRDGDLASAASAAIADVDWKSITDPDHAIGGGLENQASPFELVLTLEGSASALLAATSAIERISSPVVVVTGGSLGGRQLNAGNGSYQPGERKTAANETMVAKLHVIVLDFTKITQVAAPGAETPAAGTAPAGKGKHP